jgi:hypothetical protein
LALLVFFSPLGKCEKSKQEKLRRLAAVPVGSVVDAAFVCVPELPLLSGKASLSGGRVGFAQ